MPKILFAEEIKEYCKQGMSTGARNLLADIADVTLIWWCVL